MSVFSFRIHATTYLASWTVFGCHMNCLMLMGCWNRQPNSSRRGWTGLAGKCGQRIGALAQMVILTAGASSRTILQDALYSP